MFGLFQTIFYFSYMALGSIALGLLCGKSSASLSPHLSQLVTLGTVGYVGTRLFVRKIYATVKID